MNWLLLATVFSPLVGIALILAFGSGGPSAARRIALVTSLVTLFLAGRLTLDFVNAAPGVADPVAPVNLAWFANSAIQIRFSLGLDGLSLWMFGLSALLTVTSVLVSWEAITERPAAFYSLLLLLESGMLGVFTARDIILFYIFFEFTLIPLFFLIGIWGSEERRYAAQKFFLFTLAGSLLTFLGLLAIVLWNFQHSADGKMTFAISDLVAGLAAHPMDHRLQVLVFLALFAGFAIKVPLFPFHTWLPLAHVQAPTAGSVILAGILLKIGTYGFLRFSLPLLPDATATCVPYVLWLSAAGIIYGALVAVAQTDIKRLIAYSSVSHLGFCMLGIFALNPLGVQGGVLQMVNHGLSTGGLFAIVGMIYERYHTRQIADLGGLARRTPLLAVFMLLFTFSSIGLPGLNGFAGEFLLLVGMFQRGWAEALPLWAAQWKAIAVLAVFGVVLGAWYMLWLVERVFFGPLKEKGSDHGHSGDHDHHAPVPDMKPREVLALAPLVVFMFWIGLAPGQFLRPMAPDLDRASAAATAALEDQRHLQNIRSLTSVGNALRGVPDPGIDADLALHGTAQRPFPTEPTATADGGAQAVNPQTIACVLPELVLVAVATLIYLGGAFFGPKRNWTWFALGGIALAGAALWRQYHTLHWIPGVAQPLAAVAIDGPLAADLFGQYIRWLALLVGLMFVLLSSRPASDVQAPEFLGTLLMAIAGVMLVGAARELALLFVGLELVSIPTYVLLYLGRRDAASQESTVKYFFLSILSSAVLLYGFSFLYGMAGSTDLGAIAKALTPKADEPARFGALAPVALVLIVAGLAFRITAVPFHFYAPDVYQGTTNGNAGFLSVMPKIVGIAALVRIVVVAMPGLEKYGWGVAIILSLLTMTLGNVLALWQDNLRRLLAYSSIAHAGYMLIGLAVGFATATSAKGNDPQDGVGATLFYLAVYALATTGTFAALVYLASRERQIDGVEELAGLGRTHPWTAIAIAVFMFSLAGIPPLAGFWGKLSLFFSALDVGAARGTQPALANWFLGLAIAGALNAAIAAAYYLRIIGVMYFRAPVSTPKAQGGRGAAAALFACAALVLAVGLYPIPLVSGSVAASRSAHATPASQPPETVAAVP